MSYNPEEVAVRVSDVTKIYKIFSSPMKRFLYQMFRMNTGSSFLALDHVSFEVKKGESFGIIGRNSSGKSTMLQILAGIINATFGEIEVNGRVAALLELGSGFSPESTGYENIYINAAIMGLSKEEIEEKAAQIIEFADIGDFINQPVKTYSSGMYVRLAFAVAINVNADILLIDEALAVGDVFFRQKCYARLNRLKAEGKTIILVSHGMNEVEQFCDRSLLLNHSRMIFLGDCKTAVQRYYLLDQKQDIIMAENDDEDREIDQINSEEAFPDNWSLKERIFFDLSNVEVVSDGEAKIINIGSFDQDGHPKISFEQGEECFFYYEIKVMSRMPLPIVSIILTNQNNVIVHGKDNLQINNVKMPTQIQVGTTLRCLQSIRLDLAVGEYILQVGCGAMERRIYENRMYLSQAEVDSHVNRMCILKAGRIAVSEKKIGRPMKQMFHGCCDLPGQITIIR